MYSGRDVRMRDGLGAGVLKQTHMVPWALRSPYDRSARRICDHGSPKLKSQAPKGITSKRWPSFDIVVSSKRSSEYTCSSHILLSFLTHLRRNLFLLDDRGDCTMHRALLWSEIVDSIFSFLRAEHRAAYDSAPASMAALARTCRALSEPALDIIWEHASPWNLAQCMDTEIWNMRETTLAGGRTSMTLVSGRV
jgi:hypothetical protein